MRVEETSSHQLQDQPSEDICAELTRAEDSADQADDLGDKRVDGYLQNLAQWRQIFLGRGLAQPACRRNRVSGALCRMGSHLVGTRSKDAESNDHMPNLWQKRSQTLLSFKSHLENCSTSNDIPEHFSKWQQWEPEVLGNTPSDMTNLVAGGEYDRVYSAGGHRAPMYGPEGAPVISMAGKGQIRRERAEHLMSFHLLRKSAPGTELGNISQVVQFGGGTGDLPAMFFDLGYNGTHLVYDTEPMLLMQLYWLRMGGIPAFLGENVVSSSRAVRNRIVLESTDTQSWQMLKSHLDLSAKTAAHSLFWGGKSFMEAPEALREKLRPMVQTFGLIFMVYCHDGLKCQNNTDYVSRWVQEDLKVTHNVLAWLGEGNNAYFVALRKDRGNVTCLRELNCTNKTMLTVGPQSTNTANTEVKPLFSSLSILLSKMRLPSWRTDGFFMALILSGAACAGVCVLAATPRKESKFISGQAHLMDRLPYLRRLVSKRSVQAGSGQPGPARASGNGGLA